jgi:membrane dipeptidase
MNRRQFSTMVAGAAASTLLPDLRAFANAAASNAAAELYGRSFVLDCNSYPPTKNGVLPLPKSDLDMVRNSGLSVIKASIGGINAGFGDTVEEIAYLLKLTEVHPDHFFQVRVPADLKRAKAEGKLGIIFSFESVEMLEGKVDRLNVFRDLGVRVMQLSYNRKSPFAAGVMEPDGGGLTTLGHEAVERMNKVGITIDVSHANAQTTVDVIASSSRPVAMTHTGCAAIHVHPRTKTDEQLRALAEKGGVVGIFDLPYLTASPKQPSVDDYMAHVEHALKVAGEDHVGIGSDTDMGPFDTSEKAMAEFWKAEEARKKAGLAAPEEDRPLYVEGMNTPRRIEVITEQLLKRGYSPRVAEKVIGQNFARLFSETWSV